MSSLKCCVTFNITKTPDRLSNYFPYVIATDDSCSTKLHEDARLKVLARNNINEERCVFVWVCRPSREGVYAWCNKRTVSPRMDKWIQKQYADLKITTYAKLSQDPTVCYINGPCFAH